MELWLFLNMGVALTGGEPKVASVTVGMTPAWGWSLPPDAGSRGAYGEAMPDQAALIEAQIPGLRRFACALLRGDRHRADDLVQDGAPKPAY